MEIKRELYLSNYRIDHNKSKSAEYALFKKILNDFYASYNIINPDTIIHIPPLDADVKEVLFKYICPNCLSALISEWIYIEHICMPTKHVKDQYKEEAYRIEHETLSGLLTKVFTIYSTNCWSIVAILFPF